MSYAFVVESGPRAGLRLPVSNRESVILGRGADADLHLPEEDRRISRCHARVEVRPDGVYLHDLAERRSTSVNGLTVRWARLSPGNVVRLGNTLLRLVYDGTDGPAAEAGANDVSVYEVVDFGQYHSGPLPAVRGRRLSTLHTPAVQDGPAKSEDATVFEEALSCDSCGASGHPPPSPDLWDAAWLCPSCCDKRRQTELGVPERVGDFDVLRVLWRGGQGLLLEAVTADHGIHAVVKMVPAEQVSQRTIDRFVREQRIAAAMRHPNIVRCYDVGKHDGRPYIASEFVGGRNASEIHGAAQPVHDMLWLGADLFRALGYAHDLGIVHRDVSPANVLLAEKGSGARAKLADFGLAKSKIDFQSLAITMAGDAGGSTLTMGPEQLMDFVHVKPAADVYSAAATLFFMLTGETPLVLPCPYDSAPFHMRREAIICEKRRSLGDLRSDIPGPVVGLVDELLTHDPATRERLHAKEIAAALSELAERTARANAPSRFDTEAPTITKPNALDNEQPNRLAMALSSLEQFIFLLERRVDDAATDVRVAADEEDPARVERALSRHQRFQEDVETAVARWEELVSLS